MYLFDSPSTRPNLLYLTHRVPYPPDKGDRIRNYHLLRFLAQRADVHLACLADEPAHEETLAALRPLCARLAVVPLDRWAQRGRMVLSLLRGGTASEGAFATPEMETVLNNWGGSLRFDAVLTSASSLVPYLRLPVLRDVPAVVDLVDVDSQKWLDYSMHSSGPASWLFRMEGKRLRRLEGELPSWAQAVTLVSKPEAVVYRRYCVPGNIEVVFNGVDLDYFRPVDQRTLPACVFVGALDYRPNVDGACWFCKEVWPRVRSRSPHAELWLVGRRPVAAVRRLARVPGVHLVGQVPDVRPYLARASVAVAPLRLARGVQNKVLEALAMAKAVVASPAALVALGVQSGAEVLAASSPEQWEEAVVNLLEDADRRRSLGTAGRAYVETHHHWGRCLEPFASLLGLPADVVIPQEPALEVAERRSA
jgi:sugar transferase (PEP-CTERM/EpsH1 system associated)